MIALEWIALACAALPAALFLRNLRIFDPARRRDDSAQVSILIPARDEETNIRAAVEAAVGNPGAEVLVLDDGSTDHTYEIVAEIAAREPRVHVIRGEELPAGWCGKNFGCAQLAAAASHPLLLFVDADVRLSSDAASKLAAAMQDADAQMISGVPRQELGTLSDKLLVPLIHFLLLGFLPLARMRRSRQPAYGSACGQLIMVDRTAYERGGGHRAIRSSLHDGLALPKQFRSSGFHTDLADATDLATCRMYQRNADVWRGFAKNTHEGLGAPKVIVPFSLLLLAGQVLPFVLLMSGSGLALIAAALALLPRVIALRRFHQPALGALLHPLAVIALLAIQWTGLVRWLSGTPARWKRRAYAAAKAQ